MQRGSQRHHRTALFNAEGNALRYSGPTPSNVIDPHFGSTFRSRVYLLDTL
jgi:hypothetical protein